MITAKQVTDCLVHANREMTGHSTVMRIQQDKKTSQPLRKSLQRDLRLENMCSLKCKLYEDRVPGGFDLHCYITVPDTKDTSDKNLFNASMNSLNSCKLTAEAMCTAEDQDSEESRSNNKFCVPTKKLVQLTNDFSHPSLWI